MLLIAKRTQSNSTNETACSQRWAFRRTLHSSSETTWNDRKKSMTIESRAFFEAIFVFVVLIHFSIESIESLNHYWTLHRRKYVSQFLHCQKIIWWKLVASIKWHIFRMHFTQTQKKRIHSLYQIAFVFGNCDSIYRIISAPLCRISSDCGQYYY